MSILRIVKSMLRKTFAVFAIVFSSAVLFFAIIITLVRVESPVIKSETPRIQVFLSQLLQTPVEVKSISLSWHGVMPVIDIEQFKIYSPDRVQTLFSAGKIFTRIKIFDSLIHRRIQIGYLYINYVNLLFAKDEQNQWQLVNLSPLIARFSQMVSKDFSDSFLLEVQHSSIGVQKIFPHYLPIRDCRARVMINKTQENFDIEIKRLSLRNPDLQVSGDAQWKDNQFNFQCHAHVLPSIIPTLNNLLPHTILDESLIQWLVNSIKYFDGITSDVTLVQGRVRVKLWVNNLTLQYDPLWPLAEKVNAELVFTNQGMDAQIASGKVSGADIHDVHVSIPDFSQSVLTVQGKIRTLASHLLEFVFHSPLQKTLGTTLKSVSVENNVLFNLLLNIPLEDEKAKTHLSGSVLFSQNPAKIFTDVPVQNVVGEISFDENGLTGKSLQGLIWNKPIKAQITPSKYTIEYPGWDVIISNTPTQDYRASINNQTTAGIVDFSSKKIRAKLKYLLLNDDKKSKKNEDKNQLSIHPEKIPLLEVVIERFEYLHKAFGQIKFKTVPVHNGLKLESLQSSLGATTIQMTGFWNNRSSAVTGVLLTHNSAQMFKNWHLPESLQSAFLKLDYQLNWQGVLYRPDLKTLTGKMKLTSGAGELLNVGSQAKNDFGRLLTILSFQSLAKRMQLDFSDFSKSGLSFDSISGDFVLLHGVASTDNLVIEGAVATIQMTGSIDLVNETYQLKFTVTPHLTASLPVVATLAGGPVAGAAAWAAGKIINPIINKISSDIYTVTGTWDNPSIRS